MPVQSPFPEQCRFWITVCAGAVGGACALARIEASFKSAVVPPHSLSLLRYSGPDRVECSLAAGNNILLMKPNPNGKQSFPQGCYSTMQCWSHTEETCRVVEALICLRAEKIIGSGAQNLFPVEMCFLAISCGLYILFALLSVRKVVF